MDSNNVMERLDAIEYYEAKVNIVKEEVCPFVEFICSQHLTFSKVYCN